MQDQENLDKEHFAEKKYVLISCLSFEEILKCSLSLKCCIFTERFFHKINKLKGFTLSKLILANCYIAKNIFCIKKLFKIKHFKILFHNNATYQLKYQHSNQLFESDL